MSDVKALIAEARRWTTPAVRAHVSHELLDTLDALADALEASVQAPDTSVQDVLDILDDFHGDNRMGYDAYTNLHDAIARLSVQAPAVDRLAAIDALAKQDALSEEVWSSREFIYGPLVDALIASGILQDAAEVEARGLEKAADATKTPRDGAPYEVWAWCSDWLRARAQQVREGN